MGLKPGINLIQKDRGFGRVCGQDHLPAPFKVGRKSGNGRFPDNGIDVFYGKAVTLAGKLAFIYC